MTMEYWAQLFSLQSQQLQSDNLLWVYPDILQEFSSETYHLLSNCRTIYSFPSTGIIEWPYSFNTMQTMPGAPLRAFKEQNWRQNSGVCMQESWSFSSHCSQPRGFLGEGKAFRGKRMLCSQLQNWFDTYWKYYIKELVVNFSWIPSGNQIFNLWFISIT